MQHHTAEGSLIVEKTGNTDTPVSVTILDNYDATSRSLRLTGSQAKQLAEELLSIWGEDLDDD